MVQENHSHCSCDDNTRNSNTYQRDAHCFSNGEELGLTGHTFISETIRPELLGTAITF